MIKLAEIRNQGILVFILAICCSCSENFEKSDCLKKADRISQMYCIDSSFFGKHLIKDSFRRINGKKTYTTLPADGCIQNHEMAIRLACIYWELEYKKQINSEKPFNTALIADSVWVVEGTLPEGHDGGTVHIEMLKRTGQVINLTHFK